MATSEEVRVREFCPDDAAGVVALLNEVFSEDDDNYVPRTLEQWAWIYEQNPQGNQIIVAEDPSGRIVGHYAGIPYQTLLQGRVGVSGQGVDSMVSKEYRRGLKSEGLFLRTAWKYFETFGCHPQNFFTYGFPNKKAMRIGTRILKYLPIQAPVPSLGRNLYSRPDDRDVNVGADPAGDVVELEGFDGRVDALWERLRPEIAMGAVRDSRFLNWRYGTCPLAPYRAFGLEDGGGGLRGLYVSRANWTGPPILALVELLVPDADLSGALRLVAHAVAQARSTGQHRVEVWIPPHRDLYRVVSENGFTPEDSLFNLCIKMHHPGIEADWIRSNWYYSLGDTDTF